MKRLFMISMALCAWMISMAQKQSLFDSGWQFTRNGKTITVDLPHDWDIYEAPDPSTGATGTDGGWYPGGKGEYRKTFATPKAEIVKLHFEGVYQKAEVFVNGQKAGQHAYGYTPFTVDVTPYLYQDKRENEVLDVAGYNYMIHKHKEDHARDPKRIIWQTESYPRDAFKNWALVQDYPYIIGDIVWTGLDYLGESGIGRYYYEGEHPGEHYVEGGQPDWHGAYCGDVDITGWRKPISHYREMLWKTTVDMPEHDWKDGQMSSTPIEDDGLYIAVKEPDGYHGKIHQTAWSVWPTWESWNWEGSRDPKGATVSSWKGKPIEVEVYTKDPQVKLFLNDKLIDTKNVNRSTAFKAVFAVPYEAGTLRAETCWGRIKTLSTAGKPARLRLTPDRSVMTADGQDLSFITVEVVDRNGNICPNAAIPCEAIVKGQGTLLSFASADLKDREPYTSPRVTTWKGRALLVVRSSQKKGKAQISIKSSLPTVSLSIQSITPSK